MSSSSTANDTDIPHPPILPSCVEAEPQAAAANVMAETANPHSNISNISSTCSSRSTTATTGNHATAASASVPRSPLQYMQAGETSLDQVRERLHTALAQTRMLRHNLTERLYDKYRVVLQPVPVSVQDILQTISSRPKWVQAELIKRINFTCSEKEMEKQEALDLAAEMAAANAAGHVLPLLKNLKDVDHAEQLSWISAGLSLVILPEDDTVSDEQLRNRGFVDRGPFDLHTGQKVQNITLAAATAGQIIIERVRRGAWLRNERKRKREQGVVLQTSDDGAPLYPSTNIGANYTAIPTVTTTINNSSTKQSLPEAVSRLKMKKYNLQTICPTTALPKKPKATPSHLLSLSPKDEAVGLANESSWTAATYALLSHRKPLTLTTEQMAQVNTQPSLYEHIQTHSMQADPAIHAILQSFIDTDISWSPTSMHINDHDHPIESISVSKHEGLLQSSHPASYTIDPNLVLSVLYAIGLVVDSSSSAFMDDIVHGNNSPLRDIVGKTRIDDTSLSQVWKPRISTLISQRCKSYTTESNTSSDINMHLHHTNQFLNDTPNNTFFEDTSTVCKDEEKNHIDSDISAPNNQENRCVHEAFPSNDLKEKAVEQDDMTDSHQSTVISLNGESPRIADHPSVQGIAPNQSTTTSRLFDYSQTNNSHSNSLGTASSYPYQKSCNTDYRPTIPLTNFLYPNPNYLHSLPYTTGLSPYQLAQLPNVSPNSFIPSKLTAAPIIINSSQPTSQHTAFSNIAQWPTAGYASHFGGSLPNSSVICDTNAMLCTQDGLSNAYPSSLTTVGVSIIQTQSSSKENHMSNLSTAIKEGKKLDSCQDPITAQADTDSGPVSLEYVNENLCEKTNDNDIPSSIANTINDIQVDRIAQGMFHTIIPEYLGVDEVLETYILKHLHAAADTVPIPKDWIETLLKERLKSLSVVKSSSGLNGITDASCNVSNSIVRLWLWKRHRGVFESALLHRNRIEDNEECNWLSYMAVDFALRSINPIMKESDGNIGSKLIGTHAKSVTYLVQMAYLISKRLTESLTIFPVLDEILPNMNLLTSFVKDQQTSALKTISRERALLASFVSRNIRMSEMFSHSYTSSMIRAGETLSYGVLCELTRDENTGTSSMLPFDYVTDVYGTWEDPCRLAFNDSYYEVGEQLTRRAHARALITKSLRKLQDRYSITGGTANEGPYCERSSSDTTPCIKRSASISLPLKVGAPTLNRSSSMLKRKSSFCSASDAITGVSMSVPTLFNSSCYSTPYFVDMDELENRPYGRYSASDDNIRTSAEIRLATTTKRPRLESQSIDLSPVRSTYEIEWADIANLFQTTSAANNSVDRLLLPRSLSFQGDLMFNTNLSSNATIFAPYCQRMETADKEDVSDTDEDISDSRLLASHQVVLDKMKQKLDAIMEIRRKYQDRSRKRP